jgi:RimJ/RimL family protein N-acetyltransferase
MELEDDGERISPPAASRRLAIDRADNHDRSALVCGSSATTRRGYIWTLRRLCFEAVLILAAFTVSGSRVAPGAILVAIALVAAAMALEQSSTVEVYLDSLAWLIASLTLAIVVARAVFAPGKVTFHRIIKCRRDDLLNFPRACESTFLRTATDGMRMSPDTNLQNIVLISERLTLGSLTEHDAGESFAFATPTLTRFMAWDPSSSPTAFAQIWREWLPKIAAGTDLALVVRVKSSGEFLGMAGLHGIGGAEPEIGIWIKEAAHGAGYGREAVAATIAWACRSVSVTAFTYPVAVENLPSRRLAESIGGKITPPAPPASPNRTRMLRPGAGTVLGTVRGR